MSSQRKTKLIREGEFVAEVDVVLEDDPNGWAPYLSLEDALELDQVRIALSQGDLVTAQKLARLYRLNPVSAQ